MLQKCYIVQTENAFEVYKNEKEAEKFLYSISPSVWVGSIEFGLDGYITEINLQDVSEEEVCSLISHAISFIRNTNETCDTVFKN